MKRLRIVILYGFFFLAGVLLYKQIVYAMPSAGDTKKEDSEEETEQQSTDNAGEDEENQENVDGDDQPDNQQASAQEQNEQTQNPEFQTLELEGISGKPILRAPEPDTIKRLSEISAQVDDVAAKIDNVVTVISQTRKNFEKRLTQTMNELSDVMLKAGVVRGRVGDDESKMK